MRDAKREGGPRIRKPKRKVCHACINKLTTVDYKDFNLLKKYTSERGKILPRRISGNCAKHQRAFTEAIKQSRAIGLLSYTV